MSKVKVIRFRTSQSREDMEPHWLADIDYSGHRVTIPLPGRYLTGDDIPMQRLEAVEAAERLAAALLDYAAEMRRNDARTPE